MKRLWLRRLTSSEISLLWFLGPEAASEGCCPQGLSEVEIPGTRKKRGFILPFLRQFSTDSKLCGGVCVPTPTPSLQSADVNLKGRQFGPPMSALVPFSLTFGKASMRLGRERARLVPAALGQISLESSSSSTVVLRVCAACMHVHAHRPPPPTPPACVRRLKICRAQCQRRRRMERSCLSQESVQWGPQTVSDALERAALSFGGSGKGFWC